MNSWKNKLIRRSFLYGAIISSLTIIPWLNLFIIGGREPLIVIALPSLPWALSSFAYDVYKTPDKDRKVHLLFATICISCYLGLTYIIGLISKISLKYIGEDYWGERAPTLLWAMMNFPISLITHYSLWFGHN